MFYYIYFLSLFSLIHFFYFYLFPDILEFWCLVTVTFKFTVLYNNIFRKKNYIYKKIYLSCLTEFWRRLRTYFWGVPFSLHSFSKFDFDFDLIRRYLVLETFRNKFQLFKSFYNHLNFIVVKRVNCCNYLGIIYF